MTINEAFGDVADILAGFAPEKIIALKSPKNMSKRVEQLVNLKKDGIINEDEMLELERFLALNTFISLAKARARILLSA